MASSTSWAAATKDLKACTLQTLPVKTAVWPLGSGCRNSFCYQWWSSAWRLRGFDTYTHVKVVSRAQPGTDINMNEQWEHFIAAPWRWSQNVLIIIQIPTYKIWYLIIVKLNLGFSFFLKCKKSIFNCNFNLSVALFIPLTSQTSASISQYCSGCE